MSAPKTITYEERDRVDQIILMERVHLYNAGQDCGAVALRRSLIEKDYLRPAPSVSKIGAVLREYGLTHGRLGWNDDVEPRWAYDFTKRSKTDVTC